MEFYSEVLWYYQAYALSFRDISLQYMCSINVLTCGNVHVTVIIRLINWLKAVMMRSYLQCIYFCNFFLLLRENTSSLASIIFFVLSFMDTHICLWSVCYEQWCPFFPNLFFLFCLNIWRIILFNSRAWYAVVIWYSNQLECTNK
jgi:hypothetical protein